MGRFTKKNYDQSGLDKRELGYYSTPDFIAKFITEILISINPDGKKVFDPATGKEELLKYFFQKNKAIDSMDIVDFGNYKYSNFKQMNFIDFFEIRSKNNLFNQNDLLDYDYYIANPPYNCHEVNYIRENKKHLKQIFSDVGVHNMYSMFLSALIDLAKDGALIGCIISDTFLTSKAHEKLRKKILEECSIHYLILCPNNLFWDQKADVRTCVLILQKGNKYQKKIEILNRVEDIEDFKNILEKKLFKKITLSEILLNPDEGLNQFVIDVPSFILKIFQNKKIGDIFDCITGISTGNDKKYLSKNKKNGYGVPFYKNPGSRKFYTTPDAYLIDSFLEEDKKVKDFMVRNKKFLFCKGITCSSMGVPFSACYLPEGATFGVNPNIFCSEDDLYWLISYLNSSLVTYIVRGVLIRSNMITSGYVSKIPVINFPKEIKNKLSKISKQAICEKVTNGELQPFINQIDNFIFSYIDIKEEDVLMIKNFSKNIIRKT